MSNVFSNIQNALNTRLSTLTGTPSVAWPNVKFNPQIYTEYLRPTLLPATTTLHQVDGTQKHQGIYQVDIFVPADKGVALATQYADAIITHFKGQTLTSGTDTIFIQAVGIGSFIRDEAWYKTYVEIYYLCYSN